MNTFNPLPRDSLRPLLISLAAAALFLGGCSPAMVKPDGADDARAKLTQLQSDPQLASLAPVAIKEAEVAVIAAEQPQDDAALGRHLVAVADRKVDIANARAQARLLVDQRKLLGEQREAARLESRTREVGAARSGMKAAQGDAARARSEANAARSETDAARAQAGDLQREIDELNAKETDRGLVVTLGDVLFSTGRSDLKGGATANLGKLAAFLNRYGDRTVSIEGHTDSIGGEDYNQGLSQRRAEAVKSYLVSQGIAGARMDAAGMGEGAPIAGNDSATGRQQNRRVEVIIANSTTTSLR